MKKRVFSLFLVLLTLLTLCTVYATKPQAGCINDTADVLTEAEEAELMQLYSRLEMEYGISAMLVTVNSLGGKTAERYANDYYDTNFRDSNPSLLLLIDVGGRNWYMLAVGDTYHDGYLDRIENAFYPYLRASDYAGAFEAYLEAAYNAAPILSSDTSSGGFDPSEVVLPFLIVVVISLLIAWGVTAAMRRSMKTARAKQTAHDYVRRDSFALKEHSDLYLYRTRTRVRINNNSSSGGRSGGSRGGRGGSF